MSRIDYFGSPTPPDLLKEPPFVKQTLEGLLEILRNRRELIVKRKGQEFTLGYLANRLFYNGNHNDLAELLKKINGIYVYFNLIKREYLIQITDRMAAINALEASLRLSTTSHKTLPKNLPSPKRTTFKGSQPRRRKGGGETEPQTALRNRFLLLINGSNKNFELQENTSDWKSISSWIRFVDFSGLTVADVKTFMEALPKFFEVRPKGQHKGKEVFGARIIDKDGLLAYLEKSSAMT